jgi:hypothetical protein
MHFVNLNTSLSLDLFYPYRTVSKPIIALPFDLPLQGCNLGIKINDMDAFVCRFHIDVVKPYVSPFCPVLVVLAGFSSFSQ